MHARNAATAHSDGADGNRPGPLTAATTDRHWRRHVVTSADGTRLHAVTTGPPDAGAAIVLIHGVTMAIPFWHRQIDALSDEFLVVAYDQRAHGSSGRPGPAGISLDALGADLEAVIAALVPADLPATLVGHSMGGISIMGWSARTVSRRPDNIGSTVLLNTSASHILRDATAFLPPRLAAALLFALWPAVRLPIPIVAASAPALVKLLDLLIMGPDRDPADLALTARLLRATHPRSRATFIDFLDDLDAEAAAATLDLPTLVVTGRRDRLTPPECSGRIVALAPQSELCVLDRSGHQGPMEAAEEVNALIRRSAAP